MAKVFIVCFKICHNITITFFKVGFIHLKSKIFIYIFYIDVKYIAVVRNNVDSCKEDQLLQ